jgi:hypothetical protein
MWVHEVELGDSAVQFHGLLVVKLGCKRMMRSHGQSATHNKNENTDSHYPPPFTQSRSATSHASTHQVRLVSFSAKDEFPMILRLCVLSLLAGIPALADLSGRWSNGGATVFVLRQNGNAVTGTIVGQPGEPTYKIVDGVIRGNRIHFFVLHEDENDPEVKANEGKPFHNLAQGTFTDDEIFVSGSRENTKIREYRLVLKRIGK